MIYSREWMNEWIDWETSSFLPFFSKDNGSKTRNVHCKRNEMKRKNEKQTSISTKTMYNCTWHNNVKDEYDCASITHWWSMIKQTHFDEHYTKWNSFVYVFVVFFKIFYRKPISVLSFIYIHGYT